MEIAADTPEARAAVAAWRSLGTSDREPTRVWWLEAGHRNRTIFRLDGVGPSGAAVVAKLCAAASGGIERLIYERVLPDIPITTPRYFGSVDVDGSGYWLFLEDVGGERFSMDDPEQRIAAARWLGELHTRAADLISVGLPDRGPAHYLERLRVARRTITADLDNPALRRSDTLILRSVVGLLDTIEADWGSVDAYCAELPSTLTHGDFRRKNVYVRRDGRTGVRLYPIDWETAGWGVPAADLAPARGPGLRPAIDLASYARVVHGRWPLLDETSFRRLAVVGTIFRRLIAIDWAAQGLGFAWPEKPIAQLDAYRPELEEAMAATSWAGGTAAGSDG